MDSHETRTFRFPADIHIAKSPLVEAWLEIRWKLAGSTTPFPGLQSDPFYQIALGVFYSSVKDEFGHHEVLPAGTAPEFMIPYVVQHQFRVAKDQWPLLQLGPGVATVNFFKPYTWHDFKEKAIYLQQKLVAAYREQSLQPEALILRYRNAYRFEFSNADFLGFLREQLNTSIAVPSGIPGSIALKPSPAEASIVLTYELTDPQATGRIQIGTGRSMQRSDQSTIPAEELIVWDLEVNSIGDRAPNFTNIESYTQWLDSAHAVIHEWFFSLINGELFNRFSKGE